MREFVRGILSLAVLLGAFSPALNAASAGSADYSIVASTLDAGGGNAVTADYSANGSIGGIGGTSTTTSGGQTDNPGYIGQLYEVTNLTVRAFAPAVNEGDLSQLQAQAALDDGTLLVLNSSAEWSIVKGPIVSIASSGLARAGFVYENTIATIRGEYQSRFATVDLVVLNIGNDDYGLYAGDGIDDGWQVQHFGENNPKAGPGADPDDDGQNNLLEYTAGTDPTDARSHFVLTISNVAGKPNQKQISFGPTFSDRNYSVQYQSRCGTTFETLLDYSSSEIAPGRSVIDLSAPAAARFYRIQISRP